MAAVDSGASAREDAGKQRPLRCRSHRGSLGAILVVALTSLCACAGPSAEPSATPQTPTSSVPAPTTTSSSPKASGTTASPTTPTTATPTTEKSLASALLPARVLPPLNTATPWRRAPRASAKVSVCQKVSLETIGATRIARRDYVVTGTDATASHVVAAFPDELTAEYGDRILSAWLHSCADRLRAQGFDRVNVPAPAPLDVGDSAEWAVFFYGPVKGDQDASYIQAEALVLDGKYLSWVVQHSVGQDYNYAAGESPPEQSAPLMADRLSALAASA